MPITRFQLYSAAPWLSSPHLQTTFLSLFGKAPSVTYRRQLFIALDGGTIALDWPTYSDVAEGSSRVIDDSAAIKRDKTPIVIVIPVLKKFGCGQYAKHLAFNLARSSWNVVSNNRGLGGVSLTSDCFYNAGWTEELRKIINHIHCEYPEAPLFAVKYLGEDGTNTLLYGAAAICSPWDLLICDRFINRRSVQKICDRVLTLGLQGISLSCPVLQIVNALKRRSSSINYVEHVSVPLLCISALDDPVCTSEAIPWDECRWVRAVDELFGVLSTNPYVKGTRKRSLQCSTDQGLHMSVMGDGSVTTMANEAEALSSSNEHATHNNKDEETNSEEGKQGNQSSNATVQGLIDMLSRRRRQSMWLLAQIDIITIGPLNISGRIQSYPPSTVDHLRPPTISFISCCSSQLQTAFVNGTLDSKIAERDKIRIGLPSKGRMAADTLDLLKDCQLSVKQVNPRQYVAQIPQLSNVEVWFQRPKDIVRKLLSMDLDLCIVGLDTVSEYGQGNEDLIIVHDALDYGDCRLSLAIPKYGIFENIDSLRKLAEMPQWTIEKPLRVATGFTYLGPKFMKENGLWHVTFSTADGALEAAPAMGIADTILDLVSSGTTLKENNLKEIEGGVVLESQAVLVASRKELIQRKGALDSTHEILERFEAHLRALGQFTVTANMRGGSAEEVAERVLSQPSLVGLQIGGSGVLISSLTYIFDEETPRWRELLSKLGM
ncbi:ATP phosphoribosyltransferase 1 [Hibiscus syriacus]|uniref:ATP phosphoribosyltransferase n=1 Tax=Hibiscus syriacus TaxID=106335 RepID=A0A6A3B0Q2_HIBSY|nr:ATP phosphoribosyltransferase 1 [Hibiscus syriacus]